MTALRDAAVANPFVSRGIRTVILAAAAFEKSLVVDRLALISAFHEVRYCGVELVSMRAAREYETQNPDPRETCEHRILNDAVNESHVVALESRRKTAATALIITLDRLFDAYWMKLGLPEWSVRGGPIIAGDVSAFELLHLCGNYLRHMHQWLESDEPSNNALKNLERLRIAGFDFRDEAGERDRGLALSQLHRPRSHGDRLRGGDCVVHPREDDQRMGDVAWRDLCRTV